MTPAHRAHLVVLTMWNSHHAAHPDSFELDGDERLNLLVAADACEEAGFHNDAAWFRWSYENTSPQRTDEAEPPGPYKFVKRTIEAVRTTLPSSDSQGDKR